MNQDSYPSNPENNEQANSDYYRWQTAMQDVEFMGGKRRISEAIKAVRNQEMEHSGEQAIRPRSEIICDQDHIEDQRIDIINKIDQGTMELRFKLRSPNEILPTMMKTVEKDGQTIIVTPSGAVLEQGSISYDRTAATPGSPYATSIKLCDAIVFEKNGIRVSIANPQSRLGKSIPSSHRNKSQLERTAIGLISIEIPTDTSPEATEQILQDIFEQDLGIPNALDEVPEKAEREYKMARYKWEHKITGELTPEQIEEAKKLSREEVFPGYTTLVEEGKHEEYLSKYGEDLRAIHILNTVNINSLYSVLTQGLMCTTERLSRGLIEEGQSSYIDLYTGGGDNVFTRIANEEQRKRIDGDIIIVFRPELFDRTDWYSYDMDTFGSTDGSVFHKRLSPDSIFAKIRDSGNRYLPGNEQMFRTGIGANFIESIEVNPDHLDEVIAELRNTGLKEMNGRPIEEIVVARSKISQQDIAAEQQATLQAIINGETSYMSVGEIFDLANIGGDFKTNFESIIKAIISNGEKEKLAKDMANYLKTKYELDILEAFKKLLDGGKLDEWADIDIEEERELVLFLHNNLDVDFNAIYEEILLLQQDRTDEWPKWPTPSSTTIQPSLI